MNNFYAAALACSAFISGAVMVIAWRRKSAQGAAGLAFCMASFFIWASAYAIRWSVSTQSAQYFWLDFTYFGVVLAPTAMLIFALHYTNRSDLVNRKNLAILAIEPLITLVMLWTDQWHGLFYAGQRTTGTILSGGIVFWFNTIYSYGVILAAVGILVAFMRKISSPSRQGIKVVLAGMLLPAIGPIIGLAHISPFPGLDITPFIFIVSGLIIAIGLFRFHLLDLTPIAYNKLFETMVDGIVILDSGQHIVDMNPAVQKLFGFEPDIFGAHSTRVFSNWPDLITAINSNKNASLSILVENGTVKTFEVNVCKLFKQRSIINGWLVSFHDISAFKKTEEALSTSENKLRSLFLSMTDVILILDKEGRYLEIAPTNPANLARDPLHLLDKTIFDVFPAEQAVQFIETIQEALRTGQMVRVDYSMQVEDRLVWFAGNVSPLTENTVTWVARDITERKIWEQEIQRSENKLRSLFAAMTDVILVFDTNGKYLEIAPTATSGLFLNEAELIGKTIAEVLPQETAAKMLAAIQTSAANQTIASAEYCLPFEDGEHWFFATSSPLTQETVIFVAHDITAQRLSEKALQQKEIQYQELVNNLNEGIGIVDLNETFVFTNPNANKIFGVEKDTLVGRNMQEFVDEETFEFLKSQTLERIAGKSGKYDLKIILPDGGHHILKVSPRPQLDLHGNCVGTFVLFWDITEQEKAQQATVESETRLKLAQKIAHVGNWEYDIKTRKIWASLETFNIFGLERNSPYLSIQKFLSVISAEDRSRMENIFRSLLPGEPSYSEEFRIYHPGEVEPRYIYGIAKQINDANGQVVKISGVVQDITRQKQTEMALEKRMLALTRPLEGGENITFTDLFNMDEIQLLQDDFSKATGVASLITDSHGNPITKTSNFCRLCKDIIRNTDVGRINCYNSDAALGEFNTEGPRIQPCMSGGLWDAGAGISVGGHHIANWLIGQVRDETQTEEKMRSYARQIGADEQDVVDAFHEVPSMSKEKFEMVAHSLFTLANQLSTMAYQNVQQARFISESKQAEEALQQSENKLRKLFTAMSDIIIIYDKDGRYIEIAPTNTGKLYRAPEELINRTIAEVFPVDKAELFMQTIQQTLTSGDMTRVDYNLQIGENNYWFTANVSPLSKDRVIWVARDITERKLVEETLHYQSNHDTLTGLYNRQYYETEIVRLQNSRHFPISIIVMDVDGLKWVNDNYGHTAGDELLQRVAGVLKSTFRPEDLVARMGGDEFAVVLPETNKTAAANTVQRFDAVLTVHNSLFPSDQQLGLSIGVATGTQNSQLTEIFKQADSNMYLLKSDKKKSTVLTKK